MAVRAMDRVEIGKTGLRVSASAWAGSPCRGRRPSTDPQAARGGRGRRADRASLALGLNYLDTAPMYGVGQSETRYGQALRGVPRDRYVLSTRWAGCSIPPSPAARA